MRAETEGQNSPSGDYLGALDERVERVRKAKKGEAANEAAIFAEAKAHGYDTAILKRILKLRQMNPDDRDHQDALMDIYMDVSGLSRQPSLFRTAGMMAVDTAVREQVIAAFERLVPDTGDVILRFADNPIRLWRDAGGKVQVEDWREPDAPGAGSRGGTGYERPADVPAAPRREVPACSVLEAHDLGRSAHAANIAIVANPFPAGDARRREWDKGWRAASGGDGMGG